MPTLTRFNLSTYPVSGARHRAEAGPFRAPHHTASRAAMVGEILLAAEGVLYLDQIEEFRLADLRQLGWYLAETLASVDVVTSPRPTRATAPAWEPEAATEASGERWDLAMAALSTYLNPKG